MYDLFISEADLDRRRGDLPTRFHVLIGIMPSVRGIAQTLGPHGRAIGVCQGQRGPAAYEQWRVSLPNRGLSFGYFEVWEYRRRTRSQSPYVLQKAYFHIYRPEATGDEQSLLFIHCDPQEAVGSRHYRYKASPHLHFAIAGAPWAEAHVPLCDGWQDVIMRDLGKLDAAFARVAECIAEEFIPLCST
jgi:hypothetical protein